MVVVTLTAEYANFSYCHLCKTKGRSMPFVGFIPCKCGGIISYITDKRDKERIIKEEKNGKNK